MNQNLFLKNIKLPSVDQFIILLKATLTLSLGAIFVALGFSMFQIPFNLAAGGITGVVIIIRKFIELPAGVLTLILNIPIPNRKCF